MQWRWPLSLSAFVVLLVVTPLHAQAPEKTADADVGPAIPVEARHQVQASDNLHLLAAYYYGDARQWVQILKANEGGIKYPSVIHPGQILRILLSPDWNPPEPYTEWKQRVREIAIAAKAAIDVPTQPAAAPRPGPVEITPSMLPERPSAPPAEPAEPPAAPQEGEKN
ncbi:MAG: hypothetical protein U1B94_08085 [candidate division NC10 bacterium]|nr:hypothetical protein [candidate division NC10 bacterium]